MKREVYLAPNFTGSYHLTIQASTYLHMTAGLVTMTAGESPCRFQHDMTPQQAREMAAMLLLAAAQAEALLLAEVPA